MILCFIVILIICSIYFLAKGYDSFITSIYTLIRLSVKEIKEDKDNTKKSENINESSNSNIKNKSRNIFIQLDDKSNIGKNDMPSIPTFTQNINFTFNDTFNNDNNNNNESLDKDSSKKDNISNKIIQLNDNNKSKNAIQLINNNDNNQSNNDNSMNKKTKIIKKVIKRKLNLNDYEMNNLVFEKAIRFDKRPFWEYYISLIRTKQLIISTFCLDTDYNSGVIKIMLFFLSFAISYGTNALFFTDSAMHQIYVDHGVYDFVYQLPQIIYSTIISKVFDTLLSFLSMTEENISELRKKKVEEKIKEREKLVRCIIIKFIIFIILNFIFLIFIWYYLTAFCAVYKNTQTYHMKNTLASFGASLVYPFVYNLLPGNIRIYALKEKSKKRELLYKFSLILQMF